MPTKMSQVKLTVSNSRQASSCKRLDLPVPAVSSGMARAAVMQLLEYGSGLKAELSILPHAPGRGWSDDVAPLQPARFRRGSLSNDTQRLTLKVACKPL